MPQSILTLQNIHKSFDGVKVLDGICLSVEAGQFVPVRITGAMDGELTGELAE